LTLRILWLSDKMLGRSAYSKVTYECCTRLVEMGCKVAHVPMGMANRMGKWVYRGVLIYPSGQDPFGEDVAVQHYIDWKADMLVILKDAWVIRNLHREAVNLVFYTPIDHSPVSTMITSRLHTAFAVLVPSRFGQRELRNANVDVPIFYIPHGVRCDVFKPMDKAECKKAWYLPEDSFVVLVVARNQARKLISRMLRAFKLFRDRNPDAKPKLFLWTDIYGASPQQYEGALAMGVADVGVNLLPEIVRLGLEEDVYWPDKQLVQEGIPDSGDKWSMATLYNAADVLLGTTGGEGFFLPGLEAQACGVPIVVTDYAAAPEIVGAGLTVPWSDYVVINTPGSRYALADLDRTADALEKILNADREKLARRARRFALRFDWDRVFDMWWKPFLRWAETELYPLVSGKGVVSWCSP